MSPILTRPIREQLEHDRIIRQLQIRYKRKHEVAINPGMELNQSVQVGDLAVYPDLLLYSAAERSRRLEGTVEVETAESVNQLEALAEWGVFSKLKAPFYLYVPPQSIESARRLCVEHQFQVAEIWTYHLSLDQVRFTQVYRSPNAPKAAAAGKAENGKKTARSAPDANRPTSKPAKADSSSRPAVPNRPSAPARAASSRAPNGKGANGKASNGKASNGKGAPGRSAKPVRASGPTRPARPGKPAARAAAARRPAARKRR